VRARADARAPRYAGGERALLVAAKEGREDLVELLLGFNAEVDARDDVRAPFLVFSFSLSLCMCVFCVYTLESEDMNKGSQAK
jgi:hypothetical protein